MEILRHLSLMDLYRFFRLLQLTCFHRSIPGIQVDTLDMMDELNQQVRLIVDRLGQKSLAVVREVFIDMDRRDLVEKLPKTSLKSEDFASRLPSETNEADVRKLLEVFMDLSDTQLEVFRRILQRRVWKRDFKLLLRHQDEMTERLNLAEVMVQLLQKQSLQVAMEILQEINRTDLQQKLSSSSSAPEKSPSEPPEKSGNVEEEASGWTKAEPTITNEEEVPTYNFSSAAGQFECSVSALRWVCKDKVGFKFQFCSWQGNMERMKTTGFTPAGPLLNITVISGKINEVFLPHWICIDEIPNLSENFSVLHMNDCGDVLEKVSTVTATHVGLMDPVFSTVAALIYSIFGSKVNTKLLIYYQPLQPFLKLCVYLIPNDPALQQSVDKEESSSGFELIKKPRPERSLKMQKKFTLKASLETAEINHRN
ncbi:NACHT, LRR and PYD domains-containing protein 1b allele 2-like isoform X2 [Cyprinodon tularosa]|uniref:NACHT, LRR and PYD domains-containing protein 1b allele 2-like isoform X2 n=1 Tax=Cyprinodon tularosa TaxID=77115 RepID=UPI0018E28882|nr:NACHT, LRR and PYD domains-containing protein 1b allele 2-like isoform X2 [Cyprinodon tularosa]